MTYTRPKGEVPHPSKSWLKRWKDQHKWHSITVREAIATIEDNSYPEEYISKYRNAVEGGMVLNFKGFDLLYIVDATYQDELPLNNELIEQGNYPKWI